MKNRLLWNSNHDIMDRRLWNNMLLLDSYIYFHIFFLCLCHERSQCLEKKPKALEIVILCKIILHDFTFTAAWSNSFAQGPRSFPHNKIHVIYSPPRDLQLPKYIVNYVYCICSNDGLTLYRCWTQYQQGKITDYLSIK